MGSAIEIYSKKGSANKKKIGNLWNKGVCSKVVKFRITFHVMRQLGLGCSIFLEKLAVNGPYGNFHTDRYYFTGNINYI